MKKNLLSLLGLLLAFTALGNCTMLEVPLPARIQQADVIVEGKIVARHSFWNRSQSHILTSNVMEVYKIFKGSPGLKKIEIITMGGTVGMAKEIVNPSLELREGDVGILMGALSGESYGALQTQTSVVPFAAAQGFIRFDLRKATAHDVFATYTDIEQSLYMLMHTELGVAFTDVVAFDLATNPYINNGGRATPVISGINPSTAPAGTQTMITISGSNFGATQGNGFVAFSNANDGGSSYSALLTPENYVSWSDNSIEVYVPAGATDAGTGDIQVTNNNSETGTSATVLTVTYNRTELVFQGDLYEPDHVDNNGNGGYTFLLHTDFDANTPAKESFIRALQTWRCNSFMNWIDGTTTAIDSSGREGENVIRFDNGNQLPAGVLGRAYSFYSGCSGVGGFEWYVEEMDIDFDDGTNWEFGPGSPSGSEADFESVAVHELGHGHQLGHVIDQTAVMHYSITNGDERRTVNTNELNGANRVMSQSVQANDCSGNALVSLNAGNCSLISSPPVTDFMADITTICAGDTITFTDISSGIPTAWVWTITGAVPSSTTDSIIEVMFPSPGLYTVKLKSSNAGGEDSLERVDFVTVHALPSTSSISGDTSVCASASNVSYSVVNTPNSDYDWTITGGAITSGQSTNTIIVNWGAAGSGSIDVVETNDNNCKGNVVSLNVTINALPVTSAITGNDSVCANDSANYSVTNTTGSTYQWTIAGGGQGTGGNTNFIGVGWGAAGSGSVMVVETDDNGCVGSAVNLNVSIGDFPVTGTISGPTEVCANDSAVDYSVPGTVGSTYQWTITGGTQGSGGNSADITVNWGAAGTGDVEVIETTDHGCEGPPVSDVVDILPAPVADFSASSDTIDLSGGGTVSFTNNSTNADDYSWDFGDGGTSTSENVDHDFTSAGTFTVTLTASKGNCEHTITKQIVVTSNPAGVEETDGIRHIRIYPNPASSAVNLTLGLEEASELSISLFNILGETVRSQGFGTVRELSATVDLDDLSGGVYMLRIHTGALTVTRKIILTD